MGKARTVKVDEVEGFVLSGDEGKYISRLLVDAESVGSSSVVVMHFTLMKGMETDGGKHSCPYEEVYYILCGHAIVTVGEEEINIGPNTVVYIPCDTFHKLKNIGNEDLEMLTIMPLHPKEGVNPIYDERKKQWGTSFRLVKNRATSK